MALPTPTTGPPTTNFFALDKRLRGTGTQVVYVGIPDAKGNRPWWWLFGPLGGTQGVELAPHVGGIMHAQFEQLLSEGPYQVGATYERTDWKKRDINFQVHIGVGGPDTIFRYRMVEQRWWQSWSAKDDGYLGVFTRTHGWRWIKVRMGEEPKNVFDLDPEAFDNNFMSWDMKLIATQPFWAKRTELNTWRNDGEDDGGIPHTPWEELGEYIEDIAQGLIPGITDLASYLVPGVGIGAGNLVLPNRGDQTAWPKFLVSSPGICWIQDGPGGQMVELPLLTPEDGIVLVDTDPTARTLTAATDPVDPLFFRIARNSELLDFFLHDLLVSTLPVWRRFNGRFTTPWPAREICRIKVQHSHSGGQIIGMMPQQYAMAFA